MKLTSELRDEAIQRLLNWQFNFDRLDKFKKEYPQQWRTLGCANLRGTYREALRLKKWFASLPDPKFLEELHAADRKRSEIERLKAEGFALIEAEESKQKIAIAHGNKFKTGRKPGSYGSIHKKIEKLLAKNPRFKNADLWAALAAKPPRGWNFCENREGKYIDAPTGYRGMGYPRFCNICTEARKKYEG